MASTEEDSLIKTNSVKQVVAPIATHLCYFMLLAESDERAEDFSRLEAAAHTVTRASRNMAAVASRVMAECDDDVMRMEMTPLLESLTMSGQHVLLVTHKINIEPQITRHREELTKAIHSVFLAVLKIILVEDNASVRKITTAAHWLLECLSQVGAATDVSSLLKTFHIYSDAMLLLHHLVMERVEDLCDHRQQENVKVSMETLRRCISMLHTAMYTTIKHPASEEAQSAKTYILHQVDSTVNNIITIFKSKCESMSTGSYGFYLEQRNKLLRLLSVPGSDLSKDSSFDVLLRDLVLHCMTVANSSRKEIRSFMATNCTFVLHLCSKISQQIKSSTDKQDPKTCNESLHVSLIKQIHKLDEAMVTATVYQVMDIFLLTSPPLENLLSTVHFITESQSAGEVNLDPLQPLSTTFIAHADRMAEVASFISALASDEKTLENVENSTVCLMNLKDAVRPLLLEIGRDSVQYQEALHKLMNIQQKWVEGTEQLLNAFSSVIKLKRLMHIAVQEMKYDFERCEEARQKRDGLMFNKHVTILIGRMSQVIQFVKRLVDNSDDPIYRNGLLALVRQAESSAAEVTGYGADMFNINHHDDAFSLMADKLSVAFKNTDVLCKGLDGLQHPHLLSPLREGARKPAITPSSHPITEIQQSKHDQLKSEHLLYEDKKDNLAFQFKEELSLEEDPEPTVLHQSGNMESNAGAPELSSVNPTLHTPHTTLFPKLEAEQSDEWDNKIIKVIEEMSTKVHHMTQYLKRKGQIQSKDVFVKAAKDVLLSCQFIRHFVGVIADHCLDTFCRKELYSISQQIDTITNQLTIITSVNAVTSTCKCSDEILVKNAQNVLQAVIKGVQAAETACIKGLREPEPNSEAAQAASLCFHWKRNLLIHRAQKQMNLETDELGLRKTSLSPDPPSLAPPISALQEYK